MNTLEFKTALRRGPYAWPGGYPLYFICEDGESLCFTCAHKEFVNIFHSIKNRANDGWRVVAQDINWEDHDVTCAHCNQSIESAYGED